MTRLRVLPPGAPRSRRLLLRAALAVLAAALAPRDAAAQAVSAEEIKAAYLQKLPAFVGWPPHAFADAEAPVIIGVLGAEAVFSELSKLAAGRTSQGRALLVRRLTRLDPADPVHVLFVGRAEPEATLRAAVRAFGDRALLVTDAPQGLQHGAAIAFVEHEGKLRFEASLIAAQSAGLQLSARLLGVSVRVVGAPS